MRQVINVEQAQAWNGYEGSHWAEHQDRYDAVNSGYNDYLLDAGAIGDGDRVLDVGCGTGQLTRLAARRAGSGSALGVDLSAPMLERARVSAAEDGVANVGFEQGDVQVHPFAPGSFDVAVSRLGIMFFTDPVAAFGNIGRALRPGGRLAVTSLRRLRDNDIATLFAATVPHLPPAPPTGPDGTGPLSLCDPDRIRGLLTEAGFADVRVRAVDVAQRWGRDAADAAAFFADWGPVRHALTLADPARAQLARAALVGAMRGFERPDGVFLRGAAWLTTASWTRTARPLRR